MMTATAKRKFAKLVQNLREDLGYTQRKMARALNVTQSTISQWENAGFNNAPLWENIEALAKLRKTTVDELCIEIGINPEEEYDLTLLKAGVRTVGLCDSIDLVKILLRQIAILSEEVAGGNRASFNDFVELAQFAVQRIETFCSEEPMTSIGEALRAWMLATGKSESEVIGELGEYYDIENASIRVREILAGDAAYEEELGAIATLIYGKDMEIHQLIAAFGVKEEAPHGAGQSSLNGAWD